MISSIDSIFDEENVWPAEQETADSLKKFIDSLNSEQFTKLSQFFNEMPALSTKIEFKCVSCEEDNVHELRGLQSFFT